MKPIVTDTEAVKALQDRIVAAKTIRASLPPSTDRDRRAWMLSANTQESQRVNKST